jgi:MYXO-CTERM domain-containing protein
MYAYYKPGKVDLTADDVAGLCAIYPQPAKSSGGCATSLQPGPGPGEAGAALLLVGMVLVGIARRSKPRQTPSRSRTSRKNMSTTSPSRV